MNILITFIFLILFVFMGVGSLNADIYTWTDGKGVKHYSNVPPEDATDAEVVFPEAEYDESKDQQRFEMEQDEWQKLVNEIEEEDQREQEEKKRQAEEAERNRPPTEAELIAAEKERLEKKIAELEEKPLDYFGSQRNKIVRLGYYHYRLEALMQDPEKYFKSPEQFEGNVKYSNDDPTETGDPAD